MVQDDGTTGCLPVRLECKILKESACLSVLRSQEGRVCLVICQLLCTKEGLPLGLLSGVLKHLQIIYILCVSFLSTDDDQTIKVDLPDKMYLEHEIRTYWLSCARAILPLKSSSSSASASGKAISNSLISMSRASS